MALGRSTVLLISLFLFTKLITYAWQQQNLHSTSVHSKRDLNIEDKCDNIYRYEDQCSYVREHCQDATPGLVNYIELYYCSSTAGKPAVFVFLWVWLLFLFGFVGIAASDFFCPNLQTIASALHLSESLTGVTFLALGNGSPDLFSTFSAMNSNMGSLALGELIGAAAFIVSVIAGSMCAIKPFRVQKHSFLRDVSFFTLAIVMVLLIVSDGLIYLYEAILLIVFYVIYVVFVVGGNYYMKRRSNYLNLVQRARLEYEENGSDVDHLLLGSDQHSDDMELYDEGFETEGYQDYARLGTTAPPHHLGLRIRTSLFSAIEFQDVVHSLQRTNMGHHRYDFLLRQRQRRQRDASEAAPTNVPLTSRMDSSDTVSEYNDTPSLPINTSRSRLLRYWYQLRNKLPSDDIQLYLFPSLTNFDDKSLFNKLSSVISSPMILLLVITLPVVKGSMMQADGADDDEGGGAVALDETTLAMLEAIPDENNLTDDMTATWCRWLTAVQLVGSCLLIGVVCAISSSNGAAILLPLAAGVGLLLSTLFLWTTTPYRRPRLYWMMCFVGFGMAVVWIYIIANEVVSVLQTIGLALGVSEAILGLTVFAVGNSLGDFVANVTMARMGYPLMAMSACFGGPMLNIMLGIGIGATYVTCQRQEPYPINVSKTILVSSVGLLIVLISSLVLVPLNGYRMSKAFGYAWIAVYLVTMVANLVVEFRS